MGQQTHNTHILSYFVLNTPENRTPPQKKTYGKASETAEKINLKKKQD